MTASAMTFGRGELRCVANAYTKQARIVIDKADGRRERERELPYGQQQPQPTWTPPNGSGSLAAGLRATTRGVSLVQWGRREFSRQLAVLALRPRLAMASKNQTAVAIAATLGG